MDHGAFDQIVHHASWSNAPDGTFSQIVYYDSRCHQKDFAIKHFFFLVLFMLDIFSFKESEKEIAKKSDEHTTTMKEIEEEFKVRIFFFSCYSLFKL